MNCFDAIIVGAGPAGSTCAHRLNQNGFNIKLIDKAEFPRVKPCAGWITPQVVEALDLDIEDYRSHHTLQPITGFFTGVMGNRMVETQFSKPVSFGIRRVEFDNYLLQRSGVDCEVQSGNRFDYADQEWSVNDQHRAPVLIGAGGHFCPVARFARSRSSEMKALVNRVQPAPIDNTVYAQEIEFEIPANERSNLNVDPSMPELYFCRDLKGYGWCFRKGNFLNVGLGRLEKAGLSAQVSEFWDILQSKGKVAGKPPSRFLGHAYRIYAEQEPQMFDEGLLLVGDASGLAYSRSGEGIRPAIESALIAADVISSANGNYSREALADYRRRIIERLGQPPSDGRFSWLPTTWYYGIAAHLMNNRWFARKCVVENWFLHNQQNTLTI